MGKVARPGFVNRVREAMDSAFLKLPLPRVSPSAISGISIITSISAVVSWGYVPVLGAALVGATLLLDWLDGLVAKKHGLCSEEGYMADVVCDRASEGVIFSVFFFPWFWLFALNAVLTLAGFARGRHIILPLRHIFFVYLLLAFAGFAELPAV